MRVGRDNNRKTTALTLVEVLVIIGVIGVLFALFMPSLTICKERAPRIMCVNNLKQIGLAFRIFATDHHEKFPMEIEVRDGGTKELTSFGVVVPHFVVLSNELSVTKLLVCPTDTRTAVANFTELRDGNISYFVGLDASQTNTQSVVSGDRNITNGLSDNARILFLATNSPVGWTKQMHNHSGDIVFGDGHVDQLSDNRLREQVLHSGLATNRLAIP